MLSCRKIVLSRKDGTRILRMQRNAEKKLIFLLWRIDYNFLIGLKSKPAKWVEQGILFVATIVTLALGGLCAALHQF